MEVFKSDREFALMNRSQAASSALETPKNPNLATLKIAKDGKNGPCGRLVQ